MPAEYEIRPTVASEWQALRDTRLAALTESPRSFWSRLEDERRFPDERWQERAGSTSPVRNFLAWHGAVPVGITAVIAEPQVAHIVSVWVQPQHRRRGVALALMQAALAHARAGGASTAMLMVARHNHSARSLYQRLGFTATGDTKVLPWDTDVIEEEMRRSLDA